MGLLVAVNTAQAGYYKMTVTQGLVEYATADWGQTGVYTSLTGTTPYQQSHVGETGRGGGSYLSRPVLPPGGQGSVGSGQPWPTSPNPAFSRCTGGLATFEWIGEDSPPAVAVLHENIRAKFEGELSSGIADNGLGSVVQNVVENGVIIGKLSTGAAAQIINNPGSEFSVKIPATAYARDFQGGREGAYAEVLYTARLLPLNMRELGAYKDSEGVYHAQIGQQIFWTVEIQSPQSNQDPLQFQEIGLEVTDRIIEHQISSGYVWDQSSNAGCYERIPVTPQQNFTNYHFVSSGDGLVGFQGDLKLNGTTVDIFETSARLEILVPESRLEIGSNTPSGFTNIFQLTSGFYPGFQYPGASFLYGAWFPSSTPHIAELGAGKHYLFQRVDVNRKRLPNVGNLIEFTSGASLDSSYPYLAHEQNPESLKHSVDISGTEVVHTQRTSSDTPQQPITPWRRGGTSPPGNWVRNFEISDSFTLIQCFKAAEYDGMSTIPVPLNTRDWYWGASGTRTSNTPWVFNDPYVGGSVGNFTGSTFTGYLIKTNDIYVHSWTNLVTGNDLP
jgi:hypothetical protein